MYAFTALLASLAVSLTVAVPLEAANATTLSPAYVNDCTGSSLCSASALNSGCITVLNKIDRDWTYYNLASFAVGHCYVEYLTDGAGLQPISGQVFWDAVTAIVQGCPKKCGNYGTDSVGCPTCHVNVNYGV